MYKKIVYFAITGWEEDGTEEYEVITWNCQNEKEFKFALSCINDEDIISIN